MARLIDKLYGNQDAEQTIVSHFNNQPIQKSENNVFEETLEKLNTNFNKGLISDSLYEKSLTQLDGMVEKAFQHKYIRREGSKGNYHYIYKESEIKHKDKNIQLDESHQNSDINNIYKYLSQISGVGKEKAKVILAYMGSVDKMKKMSSENLKKELIRIPGISLSSSEKVVHYFKEYQKKETKKFDEKVRREKLVHKIKNAVISGLDSRLHDKWQSSGSVGINKQDIINVKGFKLDTVNDKELIDKVENELSRLGIKVIDNKNKNYEKKEETKVKIGDEYMWHGGERKITGKDKLGNVILKEIKEDGTLSDKEIKVSEDSFLKEASKFPKEIKQDNTGLKDKVDYFKELPFEEKKNYLDTLKNKWIPETEKDLKEAKHESVKKIYESQSKFEKEKLLPAIEKEFKLAEDKEREFNYKSKVDQINIHSNKIKSAKEKDEDLIHRKKTLDNTIDNPNLKLFASRKQISEYKKLSGTDGSLDEIKKNANRQIEIIHDLNNQLYNKQK